MKILIKKTLYIISITSLLLTSCKEKSEFDKTFSCDAPKAKNLENVEDVKGLFSVDLPKNWKTNLYKDEIQSSIFTADTTKQLTQTVLLDVTYVNKNIDFNDNFLLKQQQKNLAKKLIQVQSKKITFKEHPALIMLFKGKKGKFNYQVCNTFIQINSSNFILAKVEVYGDSLVNERFCNTFQFVESINLKKY